MFDLSVTLNLVVFAVTVALCVVWLFLLIDVIAVKVPNKGLKTASLTLGGIGIALAALGIVTCLGLNLGFFTVSGDRLMIVGDFGIPFVAPVAVLLLYPVMWGALALEAGLCIALVATASVKSKRKISAYEADTEKDTKEEIRTEEISAAADPESVQAPAEEEQTYRIDEVRSIMDEISGLVDSLDPVSDPEEEYTDEASPEESADNTDEPNPEENADDAIFDDESEDSDEEGYNGDEAETSDSLSEDVSREETSDIRIDADDEPTGEAETFYETSEEKPTAKVEEEADETEKEEIAAVATPERLAVRRVKRGADLEIDDYKEVPQPRSDDGTITDRKRTETDSAQSQAREVRVSESGLPVRKRYVLINRRNVVNMFSEYLKSKNEDEKQRIESSINTIIIK